jgi:hypothetical protein
MSRVYRVPAAFLKILAGHGPFTKGPITMPTGRNCYPTPGDHQLSAYNGVLGISG